MQWFPQQKTSTAGFSLLEVILSISILLTLSVATTSMMKDSIAMRTELSKNSKTTHRLRVSMDRVENDLKHAYIINTQKQELNATNRTTSAIFKITQEGDNSQLAVTTFTHQALLKNAHESDATYVVYKLMADKDAGGMQNLYRGETKVLPQDFKDEPQMRLIARAVKGFRVRAWTGDSWSKDQWDSSRSDWRNLLPQMVEVQIEGYEDDMEGSTEGPSDSAPTAVVKTVVYLPRSFGMKELKQRTNTPRWY